MKYNYTFEDLYFETLDRYELFVKYWVWLEDQEYHNYEHIDNIVAFNAVLFEWMRLTGNRPTVWWSESVLKNTNLLTKYVIGWESRKIIWGEDKSPEDLKLNYLSELVANPLTRIFNAKNKLNGQHFVILEDSSECPKWLEDEVNIGIIIAK